jgi:hypothetical protein
LLEGFEKCLDQIPATMEKMEDLKAKWDTAAQALDRCRTDLEDRLTSNEERQSRIATAIQDEEDRKWDLVHAKVRECMQDTTEEVFTDQQREDLLADVLSRHGQGAQPLTRPDWLMTEDEKARMYDELERLGAITKGEL